MNIRCQHFDWLKYFVFLVYLLVWAQRRHASNSLSIKTFNWFLTLHLNNRNLRNKYPRHKRVNLYGLSLDDPFSKQDNANRVFAVIFQQWIEPKGFNPDNPSCIEIDQMCRRYLRVLIETLALEVYFKDTDYFKLTKIPCQIILRITASYRGHNIIARVISRSSFRVILENDREKNLSQAKCFIL